MEYVDKVNNKKMYMNKIGIRGEEIKGEYEQCVHVWIMNKKNQFLLQRRSPNKKVHPNLWSYTSGVVKARRKFYSSCYTRM